MRKTLLFLIMAIATTIKANGPFAPAAGQPGSTAIPKESPSIIAWATGIEIQRGLLDIANPNTTVNGNNRATFGMPSNALGPAEGTSFDVVSLGDNGVATLTFNRPIYNGPGFDFAVFENSFSDTFLELAFVEVSSDGHRFVRFPAVSLTPTNTQVGGFGTLDPTNIHNLAGKYRQGYGTPFDLDDIADSSNIDINNIRFVRIIDAVGTIDPQYASYDSQGNIINDPYPTPFASGGFDLDAVGAINVKNETFTIVDFSDLSLAQDSYWNGSDLSGGFSSQGVFFPNNYNSQWSSWDGWSYSNMRNDSTPGWGNQYSAITAGGINATETDPGIYAVAFVPTDWNSSTLSLSHVKTTFSSPVIAQGVYVTNTTMAYLSMRDGDAFAKKFGGPTGDDPDYFKLYIWGIRPDLTSTDSIEFYLADYRFANNELDYIVNNWRWVELSSLGQIIELRYSLESSDVGTYGMNTPAYFSLGQISYKDAGNVNITPSLESMASVKMYPNPFTNILNIESDSPAQVVISDITGRIHNVIELESGKSTIFTDNLPNGFYLVSVNGKTTQTFKLLKQ